MKSLNLNLLKAALLLALAVSTVSADGIRPFGYDTPSYLDFELTSYSVTEDSSLLSITLIRQGDFRRYSSVDYSTVDDTAVGGKDFKGSGGTVVFAPGETRKVIEIELIADTLVEATEVFSIQMDNPDPNSIVITSNVMVEIVDAAPAVEAPTLVITPVTGARIQLAWEQGETTYVLERSTAPAQAAWEAVPEAPELVEGWNAVVQSVAGPNYFYRLRAE